MVTPIVGPLEERLLDPLVCKTMLELGNKRNQKGAFKDHFTAIGLKHVSVDLNGEDGALALDLMHPLGLGRFDIVTNFGTSEHVEDQEPCWRNIVEHAEGLIVSTTPLPGDWTRHGRWYPVPGFYKALAALNGFKVDRLYVDGPVGRRLICARLRRIADAPFRMPAGLMFDNGNHGVGVAKCA